MGVTVYQALPIFSVSHNKGHLDKAEGVFWRIQGTTVYKTGEMNYIFFYP